MTVKAASLNHHDLWSLQGVGLRAGGAPDDPGLRRGRRRRGRQRGRRARRDQRPGMARGRDPGPEAVAALASATRAPSPTRWSCPGGNVVPKPASMSFAEAACLPTAWLTAYRMLFIQGGLKAGDTVLVQGAGGGVATALITLARAGGLRVLATRRDEAKRARALQIGAHEVYESGARLPGQGRRGDGDRGRATWSHSVRSLRPGGKIVISGTTSGPNLDDAELTRIFFLQLQVIGSTMGTRGELASLVSMLEATGTRPLVDRTLPMEQARDGFAAMAGGDMFGKVVLHPVRRTHLLTGAASGIGRGLARRLTERGDRAGPAGALGRARERALRPPGRSTSCTWSTWPTPTRWTARPGGSAGAGASTRWCTRRRGRPGPGRRRSSWTQWQRQLDVNLTATGAADPGAAAGAAGRPGHGRVRQLHPGPVRLGRLVGVRRLEVRAAGARGRPAGRGGRARRTRHHGLPEPHRDPDAGEGPRAGGAWLRPRRLDAARDGGRHHLHVLDLPADAVIPEVTLRTAPQPLAR